MLQDKIAIVTGAAMGIGAGIADLFADSGATVYLLDLDGAKAEERAAEIRARGGKAGAFACDVSKRDTVAAAVDEIANKHARCLRPIRRDGEA